MVKDLKTASLNLRTRFRVHLIDMFILTFATIAVQSFLWGLAEQFIWALPKFGQNKVFFNLYKSKGLINFFNFSLMFISYHMTSYYVFDGRTIGARLMGTRLISKRFKHCNHYKMTLWDCLERASGLYVLSLSWIAPVFVPLTLVSLLRKDKRGIADFLGRTYSIKESDFQNYIAESYNQTLPVPLEFYTRYDYMEPEKRSA